MKEGNDIYFGKQKIGELQDIETIDGKQYAVVSLDDEITIQGDPLKYGYVLLELDGTK